MAEAKTYDGSCHCGAVRFRVTAALADGVMACNCSICGRTGALYSFVPSSQFQLLAGKDAVTDYQFGRKHLHHPFCRTCGVRAYGYGKAPDGSDMFAVNVRCIPDVDPEALPVKHFDGKSRPID